MKKGFLLLFAVVGFLFTACESDEIDALNAQMIEADSNLQVQIDNLVANLSDFKAEVSVMVAELYANIAENYQAMVEADNALQEGIDTNASNIFDTQLRLEVVNNDLMTKISNNTTLINTVADDLSEAIADEAAARAAGDATLANELQVAIDTIAYENGRQWKAIGDNAQAILTNAQALATHIQEYEAEIIRIDNELASLDSRVTSNTLAIGELRDDLKAQKQELVGKIQNLRTRISNIDTRLGNHGSRLDNLSTRIADVRSDLSTSITTNVNTLNLRIDGVETTANAANSQATTNDGRLSNLESTVIPAINTNISVLNTNLVALTSTVATNTADILANKDEINRVRLLMLSKFRQAIRLARLNKQRLGDFKVDVENDIDGLQAQIDSNDIDIASLSASITTNLGNITTLQTDLNILELHVMNTVQNSLDGLRTDLNNNTAVDNNQANQLSALWQQNTNQGNQLTALWGQVNNIKSDISDVKTNLIASLESRVTVLEGKVGTIEASYLTASDLTQIKNDIQWLKDNKIEESDLEDMLKELHGKIASAAEFYINEVNNGNNSGAAAIYGCSLGALANNIYMQFFNGQSGFKTFTAVTLDAVCNSIVTESELNTALIDYINNYDFSTNSSIETLITNMIADNDIENDIELYKEAAYITNAAIDVLDGTTSGVNNANGSWEFVACQFGNIADTLWGKDLQFNTYGGQILAYMASGLPYSDHRINKNGNGIIDYVEYGCQNFVTGNELADLLLDYTTTGDLTSIIISIVESYNYTTSSSVTTIVNDIVNNLPTGIDYCDLYTELKVGYDAVAGSGTHAETALLAILTNLNANNNCVAAPPTATIAECSSWKGDNGSTNWTSRLFRTLELYKDAATGKTFVKFEGVIDKRQFNNADGNYFRINLYNGVDTVGYGEVSIDNPGETGPNGVANNAFSMVLELIPSNPLYDTYDEISVLSSLHAELAGSSAATTNNYIVISTTGGISLEGVGTPTCRTF